MKIIGHRGARGLAPENTLAGLRKALEYNADEIEFDLRVTRDGVVILHHDAAVTDPGGKRLKITQHDYSELRAHKPDLPTFEAALDVINRSVPVYVEVKQAVRVRPIVAAIKARLAEGWETSDFLLGSKSQKTLRTLHAQLPEIEKIVIEPLSGIRARYRARQVNAKRLSMQQLWLWWGFISSFKHSRYQLYAYTVNNPAKARRWAKSGLAGIVTDYPDRFVK